MDESEQVSDLIGDIYDAALDRSLWLRVLEKTCEFTKAQAASLTANQSTRALIYFDWGFKPGFVEAYHQTYVMINPLHVPAILYSKPGQVHALGEFMPFEEFAQSRFYKEWGAPQGLGDGMFAVFEKSATSQVILSVIRAERDGRIDDRAKRRLGLLCPHFRRAVTIGRIIDLHKFEAAALADSLDGLAAAVFLVDANGHLVHVNAAGLATLDRGDVIRAVGGRFAAVDTKADAALRDIFIKAETDEPAISANSIDVPLSAHDGEHYVAHVLPLTSGARRKAGTTYCAVAAVFVRRAELDLPHPLQTIASVFNLTSAEMRVLMMIVQLGGVREVAPVLGISEPTAKTHLQHIFEKTNSRRQADLVKLVAGYMSPIASVPPGTKSEPQAEVR